MKTIKIDAALANDNEIVAAVAGARIRVLSYVVVANAAVVVKWRSATTDISGPMNLAGAGYGVSAAPAVTEGVRVPHCETVAGAALNLHLGGAVQVGGHLTYEVRA